MVISHFGLGMIKVQLGERVLVFNPIGDDTDLPPVKFGADLALVSLQDNNYNGLRHVSRGDRVPFVIDGPGEYEIDGNFVRGFATEGPSGKINVAYSVTLDSLRLVHLGALASASLPSQVVEALGTIDLLFLPVGGFLDAKAGAKISTLLEPRVVVPVNYDTKSLATFLKEMGEEDQKSVESWTIKKKDVADKSGEVVVIKSF